MKVLNIGSLNVDYVYGVDHIVKPGETISSNGIAVFAGGKGLNQSVALAKAGVEVYHGGIIGKDGQILMDACKNFGIATKYLLEMESSSGHTIIQVDKNAQNSILLFGGTNQSFTKDIVDNILKDFKKDDILLLQNEVNMLDYIIDTAYEKDITIILNPSPFNEKLDNCNLEKVSYFLINEIEGEQITGITNPNEIINKMNEQYPKAKIVLTLGKDGVVYFDGENIFKQDIFKVKAVDTTAAGDTFTGYFIAGLINKMDTQELLTMCAKASSIAVSRKGAATSIPTLEEVENLTY
ncbi:MAG: ribokinase [Lachnospirales bacterium]